MFSYGVAVFTNACNSASEMIPSFVNNPNNEGALQRRQQLHLALSTCACSSRVLTLQHHDLKSRPRALVVDLGDRLLAALAKRPHVRGPQHPTRFYDCRVQPQIWFSVRFQNGREYALFFSGGGNPILGWNPNSEKVSLLEVRGGLHTGWTRRDAAPNGHAYCPGDAAT